MVVIGVAAVEGMAAGKPVASNVAGLAQVVEGAGILFSYGDEKALAKCILDLANDKDYRDRITARCIERSKLYDISIMARGYYGVYKKLLYK